MMEDGQDLLWHGVGGTDMRAKNGIWFLLFMHYDISNQRLCVMMASGHARGTGSMVALGVRRLSRSHVCFAFALYIDK